MRLFRRILVALALAVVFWFLYRLGVFFGALTTVRTPFYFQLHAVLAWVFAVVVGIAAFNLDLGGS